MKPGTLQQRHHDYIIGPTQDSRLASVAAGATVLDIQLYLDTDAPFMLRSRGVRQKYTVANPPTQNGLQFLKTQWAGPERDFRSQGYVNEACATGYFGQAGNFKPEFPNVYYPAGSVLTVNVQNTGASAITNLYLMFRGVKLYPPGTVPAYQYPSRMAGYGNFNYQIQVLNLGVSEYRDDQIFTVQQDADFVVRGGTATAPFNIGGTRQFSEVFVMLMDFNRKPYSNDFMPLDCLFGGGGFPQAFPVGPTPNYVTPFGAGQDPSIFYPEIYVPKNHQLIYALKRSDGAAGANQSETFYLNLVGQKIFSQE